MKRLLSFLTVLLIIYTLRGVDSSHVFKTGDQALFLMPTAYTMPEMNVSLSTYALVVYQFEWSVIDHTQLGIATVIPYAKNVVEQTYTPGIKHNYYRSDNLESAFWATYTPSIKWVTIGNVVSYRKEKFSGHVAGMYAFQQEEDLEENDIIEGDESERFTAMLGGMYDTNEQFAFYAETTFKPLNNEDNGVTYMFNIGARGRGRHLSIDLCFIFLYKINSGYEEISMLPILKGTVRF
jgi:hypothetical protein